MLDVDNPSHRVPPLPDPVPNDPPDPPLFI